MHDDDQPTVSIELHGGPLGGRVWTGPAVPTVDGYPTHFEITTHLTILAGGLGIVPTAFEVPLGFYSPTREECENGHIVYVWEMQDARWN
jgi:hypothetical protein